MSTVVEGIEIWHLPVEARMILDGILVRFGTHRMWSSVSHTKQQSANWQELQTDSFDLPDNHLDQIYLN